jgi:hypothetical protein
MIPRRLVVSAIVLVAATGGAAADAWSQLKAGMTRSEATGLLGAELMASRGRGFEVAIYDSGAEIVYLHGQVVAWTAPAASEAAPASADAWQFDQVSRPRAVVPRGGDRTPEVRRASILPAYRVR